MFSQPAPPPPPHSLSVSRELDLSVLSALHYDPVSRTLLDSEMHTKDREELSLQPLQLSFLLQDLVLKLSSSLSLFGARGLGGGAKVNWMQPTSYTKPPVAFCVALSCVKVGRVLQYYFTCGCLYACTCRQGVVRVRGGVAARVGKCSCTVSSSWSPLWQVT